MLTLKIIIIHSTTQLRNSVFFETGYRLLSTYLFQIIIFLAPIRVPI